jgi:hypothetical protein
MQAPINSFFDAMPFKPGHYFGFIPMTAYVLTLIASVVL